MEVVGAIDIGASKTLVGLADCTGAPIAALTQRFDTPETPERLVKQIGEVLRPIANGRRLVAVGCAVPGPLDRERSTALSFHNRSWTEVPLQKLLAETLAAPVLLEDDANAAALGEALRGAGVGRDPVAYLTLSSGVGAGFVLGGEPLRGAHGLAGEIGHLVIDPTGPPCGCGLRGDIESYAGGHALTRRAARMTTRPQPPVASRPRLDSPEAAFEAAARGDACAIRLIRDASHAVARAFAVLIGLLDPEVIVVGGGIALAQPAWVKDAAAQARHLCLAHSAAATNVVAAALGEESALVGAGLIGARRNASRS